jgi:hypothetical protein
MPSSTVVDAIEEVTVTRTVNIIGRVEPSEANRFRLTIVLERDGTRDSDYLIHDQTYPTLSEAKRVLAANLQLA